MSEKFGQCSLFLHPEKNTTLKLSSLASDLKKLGLISQPIDNNSKHFYTGEHYLKHIAYMGCAPNIQFEASTSNKHFCFIKLHFYQQKKLIVSNTQAKPPQCPKCKKPVKNWHDIIADTTLYCEHCQTRSNIEEYNWRKMGGYSRLFIEITDIFPKEAIPQPSLLSELSKTSQADWLYFYSCL